MVQVDSPNDVQICSNDSLWMVHDGSIPLSMVDITLTSYITLTDYPFNIGVWYIVFLCISHLRMII